MLIRNDAKMIFGMVPLTLYILFGTICLCMSYADTFMVILGHHYIHCYPAGRPLQAPHLPFLL